jgi:L-histidine N-alpha-methyltransferase
LARSDGGDSGTQAVPNMSPSRPFFESEAHRAEVIAGIAAGIVPLKYAYAGSAAMTHDQLARTDGYRGVVGSAALEADALGCLMPYPALPRELVEIGPGNGQRTVALLSHLRDRGAVLDRYLALDFSGTLLDMCRHQLATAMDRQFAVHTGVWDVESGPSTLIDDWRADGRPVVVGLLGQTLGNVESAIDTLVHLYSSMAPGDVLIVTLALVGEQPAEEILAPYRTTLFRDAVLEPLLATGIAPQDVEFQVSLSDATVIGEVVFRAHTTIGPHVIAAGHKVRCFRSQRFEAAHLPAMFDQKRWSLRRIVFDDENVHAVVICARKSG